MNELFDQYPFKSPKKFIPIAIKHGFAKKDALQFLNNIQHDKKFSTQRHLMRPIYSEHPNSFQFDTLVQPRGSKPPYFLIVININTRKLYAYPMQSKNSKSVRDCLQKLLEEVKTIYSLTSDQDAAYLALNSFMTDNNIDYRTTEDHDHNRLSIVNRVIRTLRDMLEGKSFSINQMSKYVNAYNSSEHSSIDMSPNNMDSKSEAQYIKNKRDETDIIRLQSHLNKDETVRIMLDRDTFHKRRSNLSKELYKVANAEGSNIIIKAKDDSVATYPRFKLVPSKIGQIASTIDGSKRGIVEKIIDSDKNRYKVRYEGGVEEWIPKRNLREGRPTIMSRLEFNYFK